MAKRSWKKVTKLDCFEELTPAKVTMLRAKLGKLRETQVKKRAFIEGLLEKPVAR